MSISEFASLVPVGGETPGYFREQLESVLQNMPVGVTWARLSDGKILFENSKLTETFGYDHLEFKTVPEWIRATYVDPEPAARAFENMPADLSGSLAAPMEIPQWELDIRCKDGTVKTCLMSGTILPREGWMLATFFDITERKRLEAEVQKMALEDGLTGLANRRAFDKALRSAVSSARRHDTSFALILVDVDDFKSLNDGYGHDAGDCVLQAIAGVFKENLRDEDMACRLGGDEFVIILAEPESRDAAPLVAERILDSVAALRCLPDCEFRAGLSLGIAEFIKGVHDPSSILKAADKALYRAKAMGKNCWSR